MLPNGEPHPERPAMVPDEAEHLPDVGWVLPTLDGQGRRDGLWQCWDDGGVLIEATEFVAGIRHGRSVAYHPNGGRHEEGRYERGEREGAWQSWNEAGELVAELSWHQGTRHGPAIDRSVAGHYLDPAITTECGSYDRDRACGTWSLLNAAGQTVVQLDLGACVGDAALVSFAAFLDERGSAEKWHALCDECLGDELPGQALIAAARAAAAAVSVEHLKRVHAAVTLPRAPAYATAMAEAANASEAPLSILLNALLHGAALALILGTMAARLLQAGRPLAALDLVNAAILMDPDDNELLFTRCQVLLFLGLPSFAVEDARALEAKGADDGRFLTIYAKALFPRFDFWPFREEPKTHDDGLPKGPAQELAAVRGAILKYVTRLQALRGAQMGWLHPGAEVDWLLPDLSKLLPKGPVKLERYSFDLDVESGRKRQVQVDEVVPIQDFDDLPALMKLARADWLALTWLCWSCGLGEVALPKALSPPSLFGQAAGMAVQRLQGARDRRAKGKDVTRKGHSPAFEWEDVDIDELTVELVSMPENEYAEMAAMFRWLTDAQSRSPWQDNLRER